MGYFSNGTEGDYYQAKWCSRCVHASAGCAVWSAHLIYNYTDYLTGEDRGEMSVKVVCFHCGEPWGKHYIPNSRCPIGNENQHFKPHRIEIEEEEGK